MKMSTYTICVINVGSNLARFPLLRGCFWINHAIWRNEPIARTDSRAIVVGNIEF